MTTLRGKDYHWKEVKRRNRKSVFDRLSPKFKSNQEQLENVTTSIYVANFPSHLTVKELWRICGAYGVVVDVFIGRSKNKQGQMFAFVRFIKVSNVTTLVQDLSNICIGTMRLHANVPKHPRKAVTRQTRKPVTRQTRGESVKPQQFYSTPEGKASYASLLKDDPVVQEENRKKKVQSSISIDSHSSIENAYPFALGGLWVMIDFPNIINRDAFLTHNAVTVWFSELRPWHNDFVVKERIVWLEMEGIPLLAWGDETFKSIAGKWGELLFVDNTDETNRCNIRIGVKTIQTALIFESTYLSLRGVEYCIRVRELSSWTPNFITGFKDDADNCDGDSAGVMDRSDTSSNLGQHIVEEEEQQFVQEVPLDFGAHANYHAEESYMGEDSDPFHLASLIAKSTAKKKEQQKEENLTINDPENIESNFGSLKFPLGFTPTRIGEESTGATNEQQVASGFVKDDPPLVQETSPTTSYSLDKSKSKFLHQSCSVLEKLDSVIAVGQALGWNMDGCVKT
ncbi:hypothetical protein LXL04_004975 [Taraxacum kok-saghyz]